MSIAIKCSGCGKSYKVKDDLVGKRVKCKCGEAMRVPEPAAKPDDLDADPMGSLLDDELPPTETAAPAGPAKPAKATSAPAAQPAKPKVKFKRKKRKPGEDTSPMANLMMGLGVVGGVALVAGLITLAVIWAHRPGFPTPEEAFEAHQVALEKKRWKWLIRTYSPEAQEVIVAGMMEFATGYGGRDSQSIQGVLKTYGVADMLKEDEPAAEAAAAPEEPSEGALNEETPESEATEGGEEVVEEVDPNAYMREYEAKQREADELRKKAAATVEDKVAFFLDFIKAVEQERDKQLPENPVSQVIAKKSEGESRRGLASGELGDVTVEGDTATAEMSFYEPGDDEPTVAPVMFKKSRGRWLMHVPDAQFLRESPLKETLDGSGMLDFFLLF